MNLKRVTFLFALLLLPAMVSAQTSASDTGDINVTIQHIAITLTNETALSFGTVVPFGRAGSVTVTPTGATSASGAYSLSPGSPSNWSVTGAPNAPYAISLPQNGEVVVTNGTSSMAVNSFTRGGSSQPVLGSTGTDSFNVGATLAVGANQPAGIYTGTFTVTVSYN